MSQSSPSQGAPLPGRIETANAGVVDGAPYVEELDVEKAIHRLRVAVLVVGSATLIISVSISWFMMMINTRYAEANVQMAGNLRGLIQHHQQYSQAVNQLAQLAQDIPALKAVLDRYASGAAPRQPQPTPPQFGAPDLLPMPNDPSQKSE